MNTNSSTESSTPVRVIFLSTLLEHSVVDATGKLLGKLADIIVRLRGSDYPHVSALVLRMGTGTIFVPIADVRDIGGDRIELGTARLDVRPFERREGEVLLRKDVLGHRLIDVERVEFVRAHDVRLARADDGWVATGLDVRKPHWWGGKTNHASHPSRDWLSFEALIGHEPSLIVRSRFGQLHRLKAAEIADLIETATATEQNEILTQVHGDPELEADVFEELDDERQAQLLKTRSATEVAEVLSRMRTDDAADAISDMSQDRRGVVLAALPDLQRSRILTLLGYNDATAGGLMALEFVALSESLTIGDALEMVRTATGQQPEALTTIYSLDDDNTLTGCISLVSALQQDPSAVLREVVTGDPIHASPSDDIIDITTRMADFNLLTLPVIDDRGHILGVITVDDALEAAIPEDWRRREKQQHETILGTSEPR